MVRRIAVLALLLNIGALPVCVNAQTRHIVPLESGYYPMIQRLQDYGFLPDLNPLDLPYSEADIAGALENLNTDELEEPLATWGRLLREAFVRSDGGEANVGVRFDLGARGTNNGRLEQNRYLAGRDEHVFEYASLQGRFSKGPFAGALGVRHDLYYDRDPDGLDSALRWLLRSENSYVRYQGDMFTIALSRISRHWGRFTNPALLVSQNPRAYDAIEFGFGGKRLSVKSVIGELDSITGDGRFTGTAGADSVASGSERRYLAAHRLDWRPSRRVTISFMQSTLYSGSNSGFSLKFANPLSPILVSLDNVPKNDENNGLFGFAVLWRHPRSVLYAQTILDDADVLNLKEPTSFSATGSATFLSIRPAVDLTTGLTAVASRTYNTVQPEGKYIYLLRGLATQFSDFVTWYAQADWFAYRFIPGLTLSPRVDVLWQGEQDLRNTFPAKDSGIGTILTGHPERTTRLALRAAYEPGTRFFVRIDVGVNRISNYGYSPDRSRTKLLGMVAFGIRLWYNQRVDPSF